MKYLYIRSVLTYIYILFGFKKYEIRKSSKFVNTLKEGDIIQVTYQKYNFPCKIISIINYPSLYDVFHSNIHFKEIIPNSISINDAMNRYKNYYHDYEISSFKSFKLSTIVG